MSDKITVKAFLDYVESTRKKNTFDTYRYGIEKFVKYYGKSADQILELRTQDWVSGDLHQKKRFTREIEKFHSSLLKEGYSINSARSYCLGLLQLFRFYEMPITIRVGSSVSRTVVSTKDFVPTAQQYKAMFQVASNLRAKLFVSMGLNLGWRVSDFLSITKDMLPDLEQNAPIAFDLITSKEDVIAKSFLASETVELLKQYLPTLPMENPYLFPSKAEKTKEKRIDKDTVTRSLRMLAAKAKITIPKKKRLRFHAFRKRFLTTCADLSIDVNTAKILVGKNVELSMLAYLSEVRHKTAFVKVHDSLRLTDTSVKRAKPTSDLEKRIQELEDRSEKQARFIHAVIATSGDIEKARKLAQLERIPYSTEVMEQEQTFEQVGKKLQESKDTLSDEDLEEYERIIEENNNNNH